MTNTCVDASVWDIVGAFYNLKTLGDEFVEEPVKYTQYRKAQSIITLYEEIEQMLDPGE